MMTEIEFTVEPIDSVETIESIIEDYHEWFTDNNDLSNINSVDELLESLRDYLSSHVIWAKKNPIRWDFNPFHFLNIHSKNGTFYFNFFLKKKDKKNGYFFL